MPGAARHDVPLGESDLMDDRVRQYLRERGCSDHVVRGGLPGLVEGWERTVGYVAGGEYAWGEDDYLNDVDGRDILAGVLAAAPLEAEPFMQRIEEADVRFRERTKPTRECIWGPENERRHGWTRERNWWYYRRPPGEGIHFE